MTTQVLEGTWDEIASHADELKGCLLRVLVVKPSGAESPGISGGGKQQMLAEALAGRIGTVDGMPSDLGARSEEYFGQIMDEKSCNDSAKRKPSP